MKAQKFSLLPLSLYEDVYSGRTTLVELAAKAGQTGYDAIDINEYMIKDLTDEELMALQRALPLPVLCLCAYSDFTSPDPSVIREELVRAKENIRKAQLLGCLYVRPTACSTSWSSSTFRSNWKRNRTSRLPPALWRSPLLPTFISFPPFITPIGAKLRKGSGLSALKPL